MGLGAAATGASGSGCDGSETTYYDNGEGGYSYSSSATNGNGTMTLVSTYGVGPSTGPWASAGAGTTTATSAPSTTSGTTTTGVEPCTQFDQSTPYGACLSDFCCAEGEQCVGACVEVMICLDGCDPQDVGCAAACEAAYPQGFALYQALYQCGANAMCDLSCLPP